MSQAEDDALDAIAMTMMAGNIYNRGYMWEMQKEVDRIAQIKLAKGEVEAQAKWLSWIKSHDLVIAYGKEVNMALRERAREDVNDDKLYRVVIREGRVEVMCFGVDLLDPQAEGEYDSVDDLPKWVQDRLAVLMITSAKPPTVEVDGVGRRIDENVYWIHAD
jgi:hypothetical protein